MRRMCIWEGPRVLGRKWVGAVVEDDCLVRRFCLPRRTPEEVVARLTGNEDAVPVGAPPPGLQEGISSCLEGVEPEVSFDARADVGTPFQRKVWQETKKIKRGEVRTYGWLARRVGAPKSARAVGQAMRANPLPLFVP